jgi:hypothetical protein
MEQAQAKLTVMGTAVARREAKPRRDELGAS